MTHNRLLQAICSPTHLPRQQRLLVLLLPPLRLRPGIPIMRRCCCSAADAVSCTPAGAAVAVVAIYQLLQQRQQVPSRDQAQADLACGAVSYNWVAIVAGVSQHCLDVSHLQKTSRHTAMQQFVCASETRSQF